MSKPISENTAVKYVVSVGRAERGWICVGIQNGRSWASNMFWSKDLDPKVIEDLEERLGKPRRVTKPKVGERYE